MRHVSKIERRLTVRMSSGAARVRALDHVCSDDERSGETRHGRRTRPHHTHPARHNERMSGAEIGLALSVFLACSVEAVEALTIVLAVGTTRSWSSAMSGVGAALFVLRRSRGRARAGSDVAADGRCCASSRRAAAGVRPAVAAQGDSARAGLKAKHDEACDLPASRGGARREQDAARFDGYSFTLAFKGVLLEGLEVVFIVLTFGANSANIGLAAAAPLRRGPGRRLGRGQGAAVTRSRDGMKFAVGVMLTSFGVFWSAEGGARTGRAVTPRCWRSCPVCSPPRWDVGARIGRPAAGWQAPRPVAAS